MAFRQTLTVFSGKVSQARHERGFEESLDSEGWINEKKRLVAGEGFEPSTFGL